jgi:CheY-like chemotaxis protein
MGDDVVFAVRDHGRGIPADRLDAVFERFEQVDSSDAREKGGTGLGLPICRSIVEQHGGRIRVESVLGEGSTFVVTLPALEDNGCTCAGGHDRPAVIVCDDDPSVREIVTDLLHRRGFRVLAAGAGEAVLELAVRERPVAILLDLLMPGMTGWETAALLKARPETERIPVVMCSVLSPEEAAVPADIPVAGWVDKPVDEDSLVAALDKALSADRAVSRVLVVEDDADLAGVLTAMFQRHGVETFWAATGREALQLSQQVLPDLLVLDLVLPDCDGSAVTDWLRRHDVLHRIPLVVYTARDLDASQRERLRLGDTQFFTKGRVSPADLEQYVAGLIAAPADQKEAVSAR